MALLGAMYLIFLAPFVMLILAARLYPQRKLSRYHFGSFLASAGYIIIPVGVIVSRVIVDRLYGWD
jgi:hypothetical protein